MKIFHKPVRAFVISAAVLCAAILISVLAYQIPSDFTRFDITGVEMHKVSRDTKDFVAGIDEDITIYWIYENELPNESMSMFLLNYLNASDHLSLRSVNPSTSPDFLKKYTSRTVSNGSLIVESGRRYQIIDASDMYYYVNEFINSGVGYTYEMTEAEYTYYHNLYSTDMDQAATTRYFKGEALLTSALDYVTQPLIPRPYILTGEGKQTLSKTLHEVFSNADLASTELDLGKETTFPEDAGCIILFSPTSDLTEHEADILKAYIKNGGSFLLVSGPASSGFENLASVCTLFGMSPTDGMVVDTNTSYHNGEAHLLVPLINSNHAAMNAVGSMGYLAYMPESMGIAFTDPLPSGVETQVLLGTSESGYRVSEDSAKTPLCSASAQFVAACGIMETEAGDGTKDQAYMTWFASEKAFTDEYAKAASHGNYYYLMMSLRWMVEDEKFTSVYSTLSAANLSVPVLEGVTTTSAIVVGLMTVVVLPLALLVTGLVIWLKRRGR